jgi:predicted kinase
MKYSAMTQPMNHPLICHLLIGPPGAGKSTFAQRLLAQDPEMVWVSTDNIREELLGGADRQGDWKQISSEVDRRIRESVAQGKSVIYDATNTQRAWRLEFLEKHASETVFWVGWWFKTSEADCKANNRARFRQVPDWVIEKAIADITQLPPDPAEGFVQVNTIDSLINFSYSDLAKLPKTLTERRISLLNRYSAVEIHAYSRLLDFERLVYLIAVLTRYPGAGNLRENQPQLLAEALNSSLEALPLFATETEEISAILNCQYGSIYGDRSAIISNLEWLNNNGFINASECREPLKKKESSVNFDLAFSHRYSDWKRFRRLMEVVRYLAHAPFFKISDQKLQDAFIAHWSGVDSLSILTKDHLRRDVTEFFKSYSFCNYSEVRKKRGGLKTKTSSMTGLGEKIKNRTLLCT